MTWLVYRVGPIDHGWDFLPTVQSLADEIGALEAREKVMRGHTNLYDGITIDQLTEDWQSAKDAAFAQGWEGDTRQGPAVMWLPGETGFVYGFIFKQDNNGTTFVVSPYILPWMERLAY